jgi:hypothetical protein
MAIAQRLKKLEELTAANDDIVFVILNSGDENWEPSPEAYEEARQKALATGNKCAVIAKDPDAWGD